MTYKPIVKILSISILMSVEFYSDLRANLLVVPIGPFNHMQRTENGKKRKTVNHSC